MASFLNSTKHLKLFQNTHTHTHTHTHTLTNKERILLNTFYETNITLIPKPDENILKQTEKTTGQYP
jgi:hypothetical protein